MTEGAKEQGWRAGTVGRHTARWVAWSLCALSLASTILAALLLVRNLSYPNPYVFNFWVQGLVIPITCSTVGVIIASRRPHHPIGWLFCAVGLLAGVNHLCAEYAIFALLSQPGSLPGGRAAAWVASWCGMPANALLVFVALLFPDGRLPSRRWLPFAWLNVAVAVVGTVAVAFSAGPIPTLDPIENPLGVEGAKTLLGPVATVAGALERGILGLVAVGSLFLRLRRARGGEREQIKWLTYAASVVVIGAILTYVIPEATDAQWVGQVGLVLLAVGFVGVPIAIGMQPTHVTLWLRPDRDPMRGGGNGESQSSSTHPKAVGVTPLLRLLASHGELPEVGYSLCEIIHIPRLIAPPIGPPISRLGQQGTI